MGTPESVPNAENNEGRAFNVYPKYSPRERFVELADVILQDAEQSPEYVEPPILNVTWNDSETNDSYKLQKIDVNAADVYVLSHIPAGTRPELLENDAPNQYYLRVYDRGNAKESYASHIKQNIKNDEQLRQHIASPEITERVLRILYNKPRPKNEPTMQEIGERNLQRKIDHSFQNEIIGQYILSKYATVNGHNQPLDAVDTKAITNAVIEFQTEIAYIEKSVVDESSESLKLAEAGLDIYRMTMPDTDEARAEEARLVREQTKNQSKHDAIVEASETPPRHGRHYSSYINADLFRASRIVARGLPDSKWKNVYVNKPQRALPSPEQVGAPAIDMPPEQPDQQDD